MHPVILARDSVAELLPNVARLEPCRLIGRFTQEFSGNAAKLNIRRVREQAGREARNVNNAFSDPRALLDFLHELLEISGIEHVHVATGNKAVHLLPVGAL